MSSRWLPILLLLLLCPPFLSSGAAEPVGGGPVGDPSLSIRQLANANELNGLALTRALGLAPAVDKDRPLRELGVGPEQLRDALRHLRAGADSDWSVLKYWLWPPLLLFALLWLVRLGRRRGYPRGLYLGTLVLVVGFFGFFLGKSPNPMEGLVKLFKAEAGLYADPGIKLLLLGYFSLLALMGNKLICGWGCPFGALQELLHALPLFARRQRPLSFRWSNAVRTLLFALFVVALFGWLGGAPERSSTTTSTPSTCSASTSRCRASPCQ